MQAPLAPGDIVTITPFGEFAQVQRVNRNRAGEVTNYTVTMADGQSREFGLPWLSLVEDGSVDPYDA